MPRQFLVSILVLLALGAVSTAVVTARAGHLSSPDQQAVRAAVARYHSYDRALADGYSAAGEPCVWTPDGAMGYHAVNMGLIQTPGSDPLRPEILLYVPRADGSLRLVGVEYFEVAIANTESGPAPWFSQDPPPLGFFNPAPSVLGQTFDGPMPGHNPEMPWHYDLHAWVIEENPSGVFAMFNPALSC
jgi:hypothetical protein